MPTHKFPELRVSGDGHARGFAHGKQFRERIESALEYYLKLFALPTAQLTRQANAFRDVIRTFNADYAAEIEAIAEGAALDPALIYALNSRSEILNNCGIPECTSAINTEAALLGQNWDWSEALEDLVILLRVEYEDGHTLATLTEPGMLAKVGLNSAGIGVCLNILQANTRLGGLPVHILLRAILDCRDMTQVRALVSANAPGKASHILVGDAGGDYLSTEFAGENHYSLEADNGVLWHSNHYLSGETNTGQEFYSTRERYARAGHMLGGDDSAVGLWNLLQDQTEGRKSVCRPYHPAGIPGFGSVGTVFSLLMDLKSRTLRIRTGCDPSRQDYTASVQGDSSTQVKSM